MASRKGWDPRGWPITSGVDLSLKRLVRAIRENQPLRPVRDANETLVDADIIASFIAVSFRERGYKIRLKVVRDSNAMLFHHVFVEVWETFLQEWIPIDPQQGERREWGEEKIFPIQ